MYELLKKLCSERGMTVTQLCISVTGNSGNLATWKKGYMRSDYLAKAGDILGVSTDYLLGLTDVAHPLSSAQESLTTRETSLMVTIPIHH